ncbi:hypothetical protein GK047_02520 [Paenibacillus sp. SYP-B3998]|uniref:Uncharacterized protein n=1 Tax=Paenibacillus sp. SYP-B3998 TaxID=2678564 RepID=A0A6G3ZTH7_9BACL|nr:hypothetical protein [Paenibacillus sp. SYP-B3998]NEW04891.1 hypothetical protein [Paenibacillus sp. SYP-B3998]
MSAMRFLDKFMKRTLFCPICNSELNWFGTVVGKGFQKGELKCVTCDKYFINDSELTETDTPRRRVEHFKQQGFDDKGYQGVPTSYFYKPAWLRKIEKLLRVK